MLYFFLVAGLFLLPLLLRLAIRLRLGIPLLYALGMLTVFHSWYQAHTALADGVFFALVGLAALSWVVTAARKILGWSADFWRIGPPRRDLPAGCGRPGLTDSPPSASRGCGPEGQPSPISSRMSRSLILMAPTSTSILKISSPI